MALMASIHIILDVLHKQHMGLLVVCSILGEVNHLEFFFSKWDLNWLDCHTGIKKAKFRLIPTRASVYCK